MARLTTILLLSLFSLLCLLNVALATPLTELESRAACTSGVHMIVAPGHGASNKNGRLQTLINKIKRNIPNSNAQTIRRDGTSDEEEHSRQAMTGNITAYSAQCPTTPIVLIGYSFGGIVTMDTLCGSYYNGAPPLPSQYAANIVAVIVYGEETYRSGQAYDSGTCQNNAPYLYRSNTAGCAAFASDMQSFCDFDDPECCKGGTSSTAHLAYPERYDTRAMQYVVAHYNAYKGQ